MKQLAAAVDTYKSSFWRERREDSSSLYDHLLLHVAQMMIITRASSASCTTNLPNQREKGGTIVRFVLTTDGYNVNYESRNLPVITPMMHVLLPMTDGFNSNVGG